MNAADLLDMIDARLRDPMLTYKENVTEDAPALVAALQAVLDLHSCIWHDGPRCTECAEPELDEPALYPCPTVRAVEAAMRGAA